MPEHEIQASAARIVVMNALPKKHLPGEAPLQHLDLSGPASARDADVVLEALPPLGHLVLRCQADNSDQLAAFQRAAGMALPISPLQAVVAGDRVIRWLSPDEWLITVPAAESFALETRIHGEFSGHYALVDSSGGFAVLRVSGPGVVELLKRCVSVDLHPRKFPLDKVVSTAFAKHQAILHRRANDVFELVVRRSYAEYVGRWLCEARADCAWVPGRGGQ